MSDNATLGLSWKTGSKSNIIHELIILILAAGKYEQFILQSTRYANAGRYVLVEGCVGIIQVR